MKKYISMLIALSLIICALTSCSSTEKPYSGYTEVCNTDSYHKLNVSFQSSFYNFSVGKHANVFAAVNGAISMFNNSSTPNLTFDGTQGFSAPYYFDGYIYAMSNDGCLYRFEDNRKAEIKAISGELGGRSANCIIANGKQALVSVHTYDDRNRFKLKLMRVDLETGEASEIKLAEKTENIRLYCSAGGVIYAYAYEASEHETTYALYEISNNGLPKNICDMSDIGSIPRFILEDGIFYYGDSLGSLCAKSLKTGSASTLVSDAGIFEMGDFSETGMAFYEGNIIYYSSITGCIESVYLPDLITGNKQNVTISGDAFQSASIINTDELSKLSGMTISYTQFSEDEMSLKIMANDSDVDIYIISSGLASKLIRNEIYFPIESDIIKNFNESCFDYVSEACRTKDKHIAMMPISINAYGILYPIEAQEEASFTKEQLIRYDSFMDIVKNNETDRYVFQSGNSIAVSLHYQFIKFFCDFENGSFDFTSDTYRRLFEELFDYQPNENLVPAGFTHPSLLVDERYPMNSWNESTACYSPKATLFSIGLNDYYWFSSQCQTFYTEWAAAPMPRISDDVDKNYVSATFAYINPYSKNKEAALQTLESIAINYMKLIELTNSSMQFSFMLKDKSAYSSIYHPESRVFNDFYDIAKNGFINKQDVCFIDWWAYVNSDTTAEDFLKEYQRQVNIWMNE